MYDLRDIVSKLPRRTYWFVPEVAKAFDLSERTIQKAAKRDGIGRKIKVRPRGTHVFEIEDIKKLTTVLHPKRGRPKNGD